MSSFLYPLTTMNFQYPWVFLVPVVMFFLWLTASRREKGAQFPSTAPLAGLPGSLRSRFRGPIVTLLTVVTVAALSVAAARPQRTLIVSAAESNRNIMLAIDVSPSMAEQDFTLGLRRVPRLFAVRNVVSQFLEARKGDRLGLVVFGGAAFLMSPLTNDHAVVRELVERLQVGMAGEGTAIGDGLGVALKRVQALPAESASIILMTDGVSNAGQVNPIKAAKVARDLRVVVHTVGIGSEREVTVVRPGNIFSNVVQRRVEFDEKTLQEIASITGGRYFSASDTTALEKIYAEIDSLERSSAEVEERLVAEELFVPYAILGASAYLLLLLLSSTIFMRIPE